MLLEAFFPNIHTLLLIRHPHTKRSHDRQRALQLFRVRSWRQRGRGGTRDLIRSWYSMFLTYHIVRISCNIALCSGEGWLNYKAADDQLRMSSWTLQHIFSKNIDKNNNNNYDTSSRKWIVADVFVESHSTLACPQCWEWWPSDIYQRPDLLPD